MLNVNYTSSRPFRRLFLVCLCVNNFVPVPLIYVNSGYDRPTLEHHYRWLPALTAVSGLSNGTHHLRHFAQGSKHIAYACYGTLTPIGTEQGLGRCYSFQCPAAIPLLQLVKIESLLGVKLEGAGREGMG
jgi:hypothetical protein